MSLVKNICKDIIEQYKKDTTNNVKFDGPLSPTLTTMIPLKVCVYFCIIKYCLNMLTAMSQLVGISSYVTMS